MLRVIYEDNHLLVCEKPVNMPVQSDSSGDPDLLSQAKEYIKRKYNKPGAVYIGLVHRLDRPVGGVIVFARTSKAAARLTNSFKTHTTVKKYAAVVQGRPRDDGKLENELLRDEATNTTSVVPTGTPGAKHASLEYSKVAEKNGLCLLDINLKTGRHHQIRAQLAAAGAPIYGDRKYNPASENGQQTALWAYSLRLEHPTLRTPMTFLSIPAPKGAWAAFSDELRALAVGVRCVYIDDGLVCVNKQPGIACTSADAPEGEATLETELADALGGEVFPVHRLDVPTSGLVLFARSRGAERMMGALIRERRIKKTYRARVFGRPARESGRLRLYGAKDSERALVRVSAENTPGAFEMITDYKTLKTDGETSLIELELVTGRTHQIRASLAFLGLPIVGDDKYGDRERNKKCRGGLMLASVGIEFPTDADLPERLRGLKLRRIPEWAEE